MSPRCATNTPESPSHSAITVELGGQLRGHPGAVDRGLGERALHTQHARGPVGLEVDPGHQPAVEQERKHVVAVLALRLGHVDLDAVAEAEDPLGAGALPDQRVERAQQRAPGDPPRHPGSGHPIGGHPPALHRDRLQLPGLDELGRGLPARLRAQPVVVAQVGLGGHAEGDGGLADQPPRRLLRRRGGRRQDLRRQHPLREVVEPLEMHAGAGGEQAHPEHPLADALDLRALPPADAGRTRRGGRAQRLLQRARADRAELLDRGQDVLDQPRLLLDERRVVLPPAPPLGPREQQRPIGRGHEAGLVRPVLDEQPGAARRMRPRRLVDQRPVVGAEAGEHRHVVGADGDVHRIELQEPQALQEGAEMASGDRTGRVGPPEPLRGQHGPAGGGLPDRLDRCHATDGATAPRRFREVRSALTTSTTASRTTAAPTSCGPVNRSPATTAPSATAITGLT